MTDLEIVATGARTPVGLAAETSAGAVRAGISRLAEFSFVTRQGEPLITAADPKLGSELEGRERLLPMLSSVVDQLRAKLGALDLSKGGCDAYLALPEVRPGFSEEDAQWLTHALAELLHGHQVDARVAIGGRGHAGGIACIERIATLAAHRQDRLYLVIGLDSYLQVPAFLWLEAERRLMEAGGSTGLVPGEAAGGLVLAPRSIRQRVGLPSLARVVGVATAQERRLRDSDTGSLGEGMAEAALRAASGLSLPSAAADAVYCDINGERYRSEEWGFFAMRAHQTMRSLDYLAPSDSWGDVGAAFGTLAAILAAQSFARGYAPGPRALVMAGSEGGLRGAMFLEAPGGDKQRGTRS